MKKFTLTLIGTLGIVFLVTSCRNSDTEVEPTPVEDPQPSVEQPVDNNSEPEVRETNNVIYEGVVKPAGISIYMEGTHRLQLEEGKFILLESDAVDLNGYVQEKVEVFGSSRPTVEGGGIVMRVERIQLIAEPEEDAEEQVEENDESEDTNEEDEEEPTDEEPVIEEDPEEEVDNNPPPSDTSGDDLSYSATLLESAAVMAKHNNAADQWLQKYCTGHIGFCTPVHRNWWYQSFGATSSSLWHVEMNGASIENIGDGPIVVNLVSGDTSNDGKVLDAGGGVIGYKQWSNNRHFQVSAPSILKDKVEYIVNNLVEYSEE